MSYEERCKILKWSTLEERRLYLSLIECYKTVCNINNLEFDTYFELGSKRTRANHDYKLYVNMEQSAQRRCIGWNSKFQPI